MKTTKEFVCGVNRRQILQFRIVLFGVSTFTPSSSHISNAMFTRSLLLAMGALHHGTHTAAIVNVRRFVIKSSLFTGKWVG